MTKIPDSVNKIIKVGLAEADKAIRSVRVKINCAGPSDIRLVLRKIVTEFENKYRVEIPMMDDCQILPWINKFHKMRDPVDVDEVFIHLQIRLFVEAGLIDEKRGREMAWGVHNRGIAVGRT